MRKTILLAVSFAALAAAIWASNDPWKDKPYQQWDSKDLQRIFQDSPWSHVVHVDAPWMKGGGGNGGELPAGNNAPVAGSSQKMGGYGSAGGAGSAGSSGGGGGATAGDTGGGATAAFFVRWISSRTFREAMIRDRILRGQMTDADAQAELAKPVEGIQVAVIGPDMTPFQGMDENALKSAASLTLKHSKSKLAPTSVRIQKNQDGDKVAAVLFIFPAKAENGEATIATDEKNVEFSCSSGKFTLKSSFEISKMADSQGRDL